MKKEGVWKMRRVSILILCLLLVLGSAFWASADSAASGIQIYASVTSDGNAEVSMNVRLRLETAVDSLSFPLPAAATNVRMNEGSVNSTKTASAVLVDLGSAVKGYTGEFTVTFQYTIPNVVKMVPDEKDQSKNKLTLELPLLNGFSYPVESVNLTVMLPGTIEDRPVFKSTYHQDDIETILSTSINNNVITGLITQPLKDQETLSMTMTVTEAMFGGVSTYVRVGNPEVTPMLICALLALLYWLIFLRAFPLLRVHRATPPEGITAGELGTRLTFCGADLTTMVFTWAQLGYIMIHLNDDGRVILHKRMEMGNERSAFEVKTFQALFGKHRYIDGTGNGYALLARRIAGTMPGKKLLYKPRSGNTRIFRWFACAAQLFCGVCYAMNFTGVTALQWILAIALGAVGAVCAWLIQDGMYRIHLRDKLPLILSLAVGVLWVLLGVWSGPWVIGLCSALGQLLCGLMAGYGGRRTDLGRQNGCQILGFRHYLKTVTKEDLNRIQANDPEYFFNTVPYAMALGVGKAFAKRFGRRKLPPCPYFYCGVGSRLTAEDWVSFLEEAADILDYRQKQMRWEKYAIIHIGR